MTASPAQLFVADLAQLGDAAYAALDAALDALAPLQLVVLAHEWSEWWARPEQLPPASWASWGQITGRGWGKNRTNAELVNAEVAAGRARTIALIAQDDTQVIKVMVEGEDGLIARSAPWFRPRLVCGDVVWPNGAVAYCYTPRAPDAIFGHSFDLAWASELHAWPRATMLSAWRNLRMGLRAGLARLVWDTNPRPKHPIIAELKARAHAYPHRHFVVRGRTVDNVDNLNAEQYAEWVAQYAGTRTARMMLDGEDCDEAEGALWEQAWIDLHRVERIPGAVRRRVISLDPATSVGPDRDPSGIVSGALGVDGHVYVERDDSGAHTFDAWGELIVEHYVANRCDCVVIERDRGGDGLIANIRSVARARGITTIDCAHEDETTHNAHTINVKQVIARSSKDTRAEPVAPLYERGVVHHVGVLPDLEDELTTWVPDAALPSPNRYDALVWLVWELADLRRARPNAAADVRAAIAASRRIKAPGAQRVDAGFGYDASYRFGQGRRL